MSQFPTRPLPSGSLETSRQSAATSRTLTPPIDRASITAPEHKWAGHMCPTRDVVRAGDQPSTAGSALSATAVDRLIEHRAGLHRRLTLWLGDADEAEDALQSAFERALRRLGTLRLENRLIPWFARLMHNVAVDQKRKQRSERRAVEFWSRDEAPCAASSYQAAPQACRCVLGLLEDLRPAYREVLRMVDLDGRTPAEALPFWGQLQTPCAFGFIEAEQRFENACWRSVARLQNAGARTAHAAAAPVDHLQCNVRHSAVVVTDASLEAVRAAAEWNGVRMHRDTFQRSRILGSVGAARRRRNG